MYIICKDKSDTVINTVYFPGILFGYKCGRRGIRLPTIRWSLEIFWNGNCSPDNRDLFPKELLLWRVFFMASHPC